MTLLYTSVRGQTGEVVELLTSGQGTQLAQVLDLAVGAPQRVSADTDGVQTTDSATFVTCQSVVINVASSGDYLIQWYCELFSSDAGAILLSKVELDNVQTLSEPDGIGIDPAIVYINSGFAIRTLGIGAHTVDLEFASDSSATASVRRRRLTVVRVS